MIQHPLGNNDIGFIKRANASQGVKKETWLNPRLHRLKIRFQRSLLQIDARESSLVQCRCDFEIAPSLEIYERYPPAIQYRGNDPIGNALDEIVVAQGQWVAKVHNE